MSVLRRSVIPLLAISVCLLFVISFFSTNIPFAGSAKRTITISNIRQIAVALDIYIQEGSAYPPDMSSAQSLVEAGILKIAKSENRMSSEFLGSNAIARMHREAIQDPLHTVVFFDSAPWPTDKRCVLYADGHARFISEKQFQAAVANQWVDRMAVDVK